MDQHSDILESVEEDKSQNLTSDNDSLEFEYCDKESPEIDCKSEISSRMAQLIGTQ